MLSQTKINSIGVLMLIIVAIAFSSCGVRLEQPYYDEYSGTNVLSTSDKILSTNEDGGRAVGWLIERRDTIFLVLQLQYTRSNHRRFQLSAGNSVSVVLSDLGDYSLINSSAVRSSRDNILGDDDEVATAFIPLSDNDLHVLLSKKILAFNVQTSLGNSQFVIKPKKDTAIKKMISLIRQAPQPDQIILPLPKLK